MAAVSLSVIIPTYNQAAFIGNALRSVRAGGVPDLEVIVADDGSTDNTREVVAATDSQAVYLWAPNTGSPSGPRNRGFAASSGRYVAFLDADDLWLPGAAAGAVARLDRHPQVDLLFADVKFGNPQEGYVSWIELAGQEAFRRLPRTELEPGFFQLRREPLFRRITQRNVVCGCGWVVRREVFAATGGYDTSYWGGEDWEVWMRLATTRTFGFWDEAVAVYTRHTGNVTNNRDLMAGGFCQALRNVLEKCELSPADRRWVRGLLREHLFSYAYLAYDRGELGVARQRFRTALQAGNRQPLTLALAAASCLPGWLVRKLRNLRSRVRVNP